MSVSVLSWDNLRRTAGTADEEPREARVPRRLAAVPRWGRLSASSESGEGAPQPLLQDP